MATFITSKAVGQDIRPNIQTSTGFWKYNHDGSDSSVFGNGQQNITITNANGEFTLISCDSDGNVSGNIDTIDLTNGCLVTSFDGTGLTVLTDLRLWDNPLTSFDGTGLTSLTQLGLNSTQLTSFDGTGLVSLTNLSLNGPKGGGGTLTSVSNLPTSLTNLYLDSNLLTSFDGTGLSSLTQLYLSNNQLTSFDGTGLSSLTELYLSDNQLTSFDGTGLSSLTSLGLSSNQLTSLDGFILPTGLTYLDLNNNLLTSFDGTGLSGLTNLNLYNNQLTSFDGTGLSSLTQLDLNTNQLTSLEGFVFPTSLTSLYLGNNQITSFDGTGLTSLTGLNLGHNQITSLDGFIFPTSLNSLYLGDNQITSFDGTGLTSLLQLMLVSNLLTSLDVSTMTSLQYLYLGDPYGTGGNPMTPESNNSILSQLNTNGVSSGYFGSINSRTSAGTADYDALVGKGWNLLGLDLITTTQPTFITSKAVGESFQMIVNTSTGYWKYNHDGGDSSVNVNYLGEAFDVYVANANGEFTIISCDESGNVSGDITNLNLSNSQLTSFDGTGLSGLTYLGLETNQLTSFDGTGLSSLTQLALYNNQLTSFDGTGLSSLIGLYLHTNQLTPSTNNQILQQLNQNGLSGGEFYSSNGRTSSSNSDYDNLVSLGWSFGGLDLITTTQPTFITSKSVGEIITIIINTSTNYFKIEHDNTTQGPFHIDTSFKGGDRFEPTITNANGEFTLISCDESGNVSGDVTWLNLNINQLTSFDGTGLSGLTQLYLYDNQLTSFDGTGLSSLTVLQLDNNQLTSLDLTGLSSLTQLQLQSNQLTPSANNQILNQLNQNGLSDGTFYSSNGRTSASNTDYDNLVSLGWGFSGLDLITTTQPTFITSKAVGETININVQTSTGFWKYNHDGSDSSVLSNFSQTITVQNANGEFTIIPCLSDGTVSGDITILELAINQLTSFDGTGLSSLTNLNLSSNQLTSFDGTDLTSLGYLYLQGNLLTSFNGTDLTSLNQLYLSENQLTSFDGTDLTSLANLALQNNQLTSFDGTDLTSLLYLDLLGNQLTSLDVSPMVSLISLNLADAYGTLTNPMTAVSNNSILNQLNANGVENGNFLTINGRTSAGTEDYDTLVAKGWNLSGLDLITTTQPTFITSKAVGQDIGINVGTSTGFWKYNHDGSDSSVNANGKQPISVTNINGEFTIISCLSDGTVSGDVTYLGLKGNQLTSFDGTGLSSLTDLNLNLNQLTSFDGTGLSSLTGLYLNDNQLTSFDGTGLYSLNYLYLNGNPMTTSSNNQILQQLNQNGLSDGQFYSSNGRTADGTADYDSLISKGWTIQGANIILPPTFITSKAVGETIYIYTETSTGFWKYNHDGGDSSVFGNGQQTVTITNANGEFTIISCLSDGTVSGDITILDLQGNQLTSFDGTDLSSLTNLSLHTNQLTSFDGTGLSSLYGLSLQDNQLTSFDGTGLSSLTDLGLDNNQLTSLEGIVFPTSLISLSLGHNQITSLDGTGLTILTYLNLGHNQITSLDGFIFPTSLNRLSLGDNQITSFDGTGLTSLVHLMLVSNLLTSLDVSTMTSLQYLYLGDPYGTGGNPMTPESNNSILSQLNTNGVSSGYFGSINSRTSTGTADYDSLVGKGWNLSGLDLVTPPVGNGKLRVRGVRPTTKTYTIKTINPVGESFGINNIITSTGYWLYNHDGSDSEPFESGSSQPITVQNANGEFTFISCLSDGTPSGDIIELGFNNGSLITDFNGLGLSSLTYLNLFGEKLTLFNGTGLTSLTNLNLNNNEELTSITNLPLTLVSLTLVGTPITSIDISGMDSLTSLYLADAYGNYSEFQLLTSANNDDILIQLDSSDLVDGAFITSNGRTSAGNTSYDNLINKGWNIIGAEEEISLLFDLTVDNGIPNQLVVLGTSPSDGGIKGGGGKTPYDRPGGYRPGGGITEYTSIVTDENGIAVFSGITGATTMWVVQVYNTPVKEGIVVWTSDFEANNSTTTVTKTRTFYDVNLLNQDDNGVISNSSVDIYLVDSGNQLNSDGDIYPIFMFSGTTDVNGNITTNLSNGSYIIRTFDENGDLSWGQYFDVADDVVSISRPLSEDVEINISNILTTTYGDDFPNRSGAWPTNNVPVEGIDVYYYDGNKEVFAFNPQSPIGGNSEIVMPPLTLLGQTDSTGGFTTDGNTISISSGFVFIVFGTTDSEGREYGVISNQYTISELSTNSGGVRYVNYADMTFNIRYSEWHPQAPTGKLVTISIMKSGLQPPYQPTDWVTIDGFSAISGSDIHFNNLDGNTTYRLEMYNSYTSGDIGYSEDWTPGWGNSKTSTWDGVPN